MTGIQSSVGLISGIDYTSIVDQLIQIDSIPKTNLEARNELLAEEEKALTAMLGKFLLSSYMMSNLNNIKPFLRCDPTSSNPSVLTVTKNGTPVEGTHTFTPIQLATAQQTIAKGVVSDTDALGKTGTITIGKGWNLDNSVELKNLNGGNGITKGSIRITDGSGTRATIDLRNAVTMQDIVDAINDSDAIDVRAELVEDRLVLTDFSGGDTSKFLVQEVSGGTTAASLGIANLHADSEGIAIGASLYRLGEDMSLTILNDGNGVVFDDVWSDIVVKCRDGSTVNIDFYKRATTTEVAAGAPEIHKETTIGDMLETINNSVDGNGVAGKVHAKISDDGKSIVIEDATTGSSFTTLTQLSTSPVFRSLGFISGDYNGSPLNKTLDGLVAGKVTVKDKADYEATIEFTDAEIKAFKSFDEVAAAFNSKLSAANVDIEVSVNDTKDGLNLKELTGGTGTMTLADDGSGGNIASFFGISVTDDLADTVDGKTFGKTDYTTRHLIGDLDSVLVSSLNGGHGLSKAAGGVVEVQDRAGNAATLNFTQAELDSINTLKDAVRLFNTKLTDAGVGITVKINDSNTGLQITDTTGSSSNALIFKDKGDTVITPAVPAIPAVPGINAVSAPVTSGVAGTAILTFNNTSALNGVTFAFTDDLSSPLFDVGNGVLSHYDEATKTLTMYSTSSTAAYEDGSGIVDNAAMDAGVKSTIDNALSKHWSEIAPGAAALATVELTSGMGAKVLADAAVGGATAIQSGLSGAVLGQTPVAEVPAVPAVTDGSGSKLAAALGLDGVNVNSSSANGASLHRQIISYDTKLADLNNGKGVTLAGGKVLITDSAGTKATLTIDAAKHKTVGDVIKAINSLSSTLKVVAKINDTGDGIVIEEFAGGTGNFSVTDADSLSKFASDLKIAGSVTQTNKDADGRMRIDGKQSYSIEVEATDSLDSIRQKINALNTGVSATIVQDGSNTPYRLAISSKATGESGSFTIDLSVLGLTTENMTEAKDALLVYGDASASNGLVLHSGTNTFKNVINGMDMTITGTSTTPITVTSASSNVDVKVSLSTFVENYNLFREQLNKDTYFSVDENAGNILWNSPEARAYDRMLTDVLMKRVYGIPGITSLADLGISLRKNTDDDGTNTLTNTLVWDEDKFNRAWETNKEAVQMFFFQERTIINSDGTETKVNTGWAQSFVDVTEALTDPDHGKVASRMQTLDRLITSNTERIDFMGQRLEVKRQMMLNKFYAMEQAMAQMSKNMTTVSNIASNWASNSAS